MYDPELMRFTTRDPVKGKFNDPITLHPYLYCINDPLNEIDPSGELFWQVFGALSAGTAVRSAAIYTLAHGIMIDNDLLFDAGLKMHHLIAPAMYVGAALGPALPKMPSLIAKAGLSIWSAATSGDCYAYGTGYVAAQALSFWARTYSSQTIRLRVMCRGILMITS